jgi:hypothetical protein
MDCSAMMTQFVEPVRQAIPPIYIELELVWAHCVRSIPTGITCRARRQPTRSEVKGSQEAGLEFFAVLHPNNV